MGFISGMEDVSTQANQPLLYTTLIDVKHMVFTMDNEKVFTNHSVSIHDNLEQNR